MTADPIVGDLGVAGGMYRDEVRLSDLSPETRAVLEAALAMTPGGLGSYRVIEAARIFAAKVNGVPE